MSSRRSIARRAVIWSGVLALLHAFARTAAGQVAPSTTLSFTSLADTYVDAGASATNFNSATQLRADASPMRIIYLRFAVTGVNGRPVQQARLRLGVTGASPSGGMVHRISSDTWNEATVTYATRPPLDGPALATLGAVSSGTVVEFDLDGAIPGDGIYNLAIDSTSSSAVDYASAAATGGQKPQLVLTVTEGAPIVSILQPPPGASFFLGDPITLQGTAAGGGLDLSAAIAWRSSRQGLLGSGALVTTALAAGEHTVTASVTDAHGLTGTDQVDLTVHPAPGVNTEPLVTITAPLEGRTFVTGTPIAFIATAADLEDGDVTSQLVWTSDRDGALGTGGSVTRTLSEGTHDVVAAALDAGGLRGEHRVTVHVQTPVALEFTPSADASVDAGSTSTNFGTSPVLRVDTNTARLAYLRFDVTGIGARQIVGATLRLQVDVASGADSDRGGTLRAITNHAWQETGITYANRPALDGQILATAGAVARGQIVDLDARAAVTGDGRYDFALVGDSSDEATYRSREGAPVPKLILLVTGSVPAVTITAPADGVVHLHDDSITFIARATDAEDGDLGSQIHWTSSRDGALGTGPALATAALSVGTHTITAAATDGSGLRGEARITLRVRDPNQPPMVRISAPADGASVPAGTGALLAASADDDFDGSIPGRIRWTSDRDGALGSGPTRTVILSEGVHVVTASATDSDGATGSAALHVTVTPTPPVVTISAPPAGAIMFAGTPVTFRGTARDATDGDLGTTLRWTSDRDGALGTGTTVSTDRLSAGTHVVRAEATDSGGLTGRAEETVVIRPPNVPPVLAIRAPLAGSTLLAGTAVLLDVTATDAEDGDLAADVRWTSSRDGVLGTGATLVMPVLSVGAHTLTATVTDHDGATSAATVTIAISPSTLGFVAVADTYVDASNATTKFGTASSLVVDASPMKQAFLRFTPSGLGTLSIKTATVRLTTTSSSAAASNSGGTLRLINNGTWSEATTTYNTRPAVDGAALATQGTVGLKQTVDFDVTSALRGDGTYNFGLVTSSSDDVVYQSREASSGRPQLLVTFTQNQTPALRITAPAAATRVGQGVPVAFRGVATDAEDGDLSSRIAWSSSLDGALGTGAAPVVSALRPGVHTITAEVRDAGGLTARASVTLTVTRRPVVHIAAPADAAVVFLGQLPLALTGDAVDAEDGDLGSRLAWRSDLEGPLGTGPSVAAATLRVGTHVLTAAVTDADGLSGEAHVTVRVRAPNAPPAVTITSSADPRPIPSGATLTLSASALDDFDGDVGGRLRWTSGRDGLLGTGPSITTSALSVGTHLLVAAATDADGATGQAERTVVVRSPNALPVVAIVSPAAGTVALAGKAVALSATASDAEDGDLRPSIRWSSSRDGALGTGPTLVVATLSAGTHVLTATVTDADGATATATTSLSVELATRTFSPVADTYVDSGSTTRVFGTETALLIGTSSVRETLLRFTVSGVGSLKVERAILRLTVGSGSSDGSPVGGTLRHITNGLWSETTTTWKTRPAQDGPVLATHATVTPGQVVDFDVTAAVTGNGTYDFGLTSTSSNSARYLSRESPVGKPYLVVGLATDLPPVVQVGTPLPGTVVDVGVPLDLTATATDAEDGDLTAALRWTSSRDGALGTGGHLRLSTLTVGAHVLTAAVTDVAGNTTRTDVPVIVNAQPTVAVTAPAAGAVFEPGSPVTLRANALDAEDGDLGDAIAWRSDRDGALGTGTPFTTSALRTGAHTITATVTDRHGASAQTTIALVVDARPTLAISLPHDGAIFSPGEPIALTAAAHDAEEGDLGSAVRWTSDLDGALGTGSPLEVHTLRSGDHHITATVRDAGGKQATATVSLRVNAAPTLAVTAPALDAVFAPGDAIAFTATAQDLEDGDLAATVRWTSQLDGFLGTGSPLVVGTLRSGRHVITAMVTDAGGKVATAGIALTVNAAPTVAITSPADGTTFAPGDPIALAAAANDAEDGPLVVAVHWASDLDGDLGTGSPLVVDRLRSGTHRITAAVTDAGGKHASAAITLRVNAAPTIAISGPATGMVFAPAETIALTATAGDVEDGDLAAAVVWTSSLDGELGRGSPLPVTSLRSGHHVITARVTDAGGKLATAEIALTVDATPTLAIATPADGTTCSPGDPVTLGATVNDAEEGDLGSAVHWTSDLDGDLGAGNPLVVHALRSGTHGITATVADADGKHAEAAITLRVNAAPTIAITGPAAGATFFPFEPVALAATAGDLEDGDLAGMVAWTSSLDGFLGTGSPLAVDTLASGPHTITATVTDTGGRVASAEIAITVNAPPTVAISAPQSGNIFTPGEAIALTATADDFEDGDLAGAVDWTSSLDGFLGTGNPLAVTTLRAGVHLLTATVTDAGGRVATAETTVIVDAAPTVAITAPSDGLTFSPADAIALTAVAEDAEDGDLGSAVHWTSDLDGDLGTGSPLVVDTLRSGTHVITATVTDASGRQAAAVIGLIVNGAPSITVTTPTDGATVVPGLAVVLSASVSDVEDGEALTTIDWSSSLDGPLGTGSPLIVTTLRPGTHTLTASVTDTGGRSATAEVTLAVDTPPTVTVSAPSLGARFARGAPVPLQATASDAEDGVLTSAIAWTSSLDGPLGTGGTLTVSTLRAGTHVLRATVVDAAGAQATAQVEVVVDPTLTVAVTAPADGTIFGPDETVGLAGTAIDSEDGDLGAAIVWTSSLDGTLGGGSTRVVGPLRSGTHMLTATVTDTSGQTASAAVTIVVAPVVALDGTSPDHYSNAHLLAKTKIDASAATFLASPSNLYPITVGGDPGIRIVGGRILGQYDRTLSWDAMHSMNNAGVAFDNAQATVEGFRIDNVTDGFRPRPGGMFTIRNAWLSYVRDDCVENDYAQGGLVDDSLFDGCYVGMSARPSSGILAAGYDGRNNVVTIQHSLIRLQPMPGPRGGSADNLGHGEFFKWHLWDRPADSVSPKLALHDNVFMLERAGQTEDRMGVPPGKLDSCSNNVMVWLGAGPFPGPALPACFTVTTDRSVWDNAVADWKARHPGMAP